MKVKLKNTNNVINAEDLETIKVFLRFLQSEMALEKIDRVVGLALHGIGMAQATTSTNQTDEGKLVPPLKEAPSRLSLMAHRRRNVNGAFLTKIKLRQKCKSNFVGTDPIG